MRAIAGKPVWIVSWRETRTLKYVYAAIALGATIFVLIAYRAARLLDSVHTHINTHDYFEARLIIIAVEVALWVIIAKAAVRLKSYARAIIDSPDGLALNYVANALLVSLIYAIVFGMSTTIKTLFVRSPQLNIATTITNHAPLLMALILSILLFIGSLKLVQILPKGQRHPRREVMSFSLACFVAAISMYASYFHRVASSLIDDDGLHHFALASNSLMATYVTPYIVVWLLALLACLNLVHYASRIDGKIYKLLFRDLNVGLLLSFMGTYLLQLFTVSTINTNQFGFGLIIFVGLLAILIAGCLLVYRGTNRLYRLEA